MKAGRELDVLVAEKVMGQTDFAHLEMKWEEGSSRDGKDGWSGFVCPCCGDSELSQQMCAMPYSTSIADAWQVVEKATYYEASWSGLHHWYLELGEGHGEAEAQTAPLAICLAALKAVGAEVPE